MRLCKLSYPWQGNNKACLLHPLWSLNPFRMQNFLPTGSCSKKMVVFWYFLTKQLAVRPSRCINGRFFPSTRLLDHLLWIVDYQLPYLSDAVGDGDGIVLGHFCHPYQVVCLGSYSWIGVLFGHFVEKSHDLNCEAWWFGSVGCLPASFLDVESWFDISRMYVFFLAGHMPSYHADHTVMSHTSLNQNSFWKKI